MLKLREGLGSNGGGSGQLAWRRYGWAIAHRGVKLRMVAELRVGKEPVIKFNIYMTC